MAFKNSDHVLYFPNSIMNNITNDYLINSFNYRRERSMCEICWSRVAEGDFELTGSLTGPAGNNL